MHNNILHTKMKTSLTWTLSKFPVLAKHNLKIFRNYLHAMKLHDSGTTKCSLYKTTGNWADLL